MAQQSGMNMPGGMGGLVRYDSEYKSKFTITPTQVIIFVVLVLLFVLGLKIFWPVVNTGAAPTTTPAGAILSLLI